MRSSVAATTSIMVATTCTKMILAVVCVSISFLLLQGGMTAADAFVVLPKITTSSTSKASKTSESALNLRVAYQGEPGAYSEKSTRELLGNGVIALGKANFEECFRAVASMEVDYCCLPIENSLGGSIHENYDLMLRYDLTICAEHEFRVQHCVLASPDASSILGGSGQQIKYAISHPQALAQCDNYLRSLNIRPIPTYDTAGSAKMIRDNDLPAGCTPFNTIAIASDLAGETYGMNCLAKGVEDDDSNFTRFLLLGRKGVLEYLNKDVPSKTSVVFTLPNTAGALYKALACFSLRDIDFSKIESRPTSAALLNYLKFRKAANSAVASTTTQQQQDDNNNTDGSDNNQSPVNLDNDLPRFRYCFYLDFLDGQLSSNSENALSNLREFTDFVRILGSYPRKSRLVGPVSQAAEEIKIKRLNDNDDGMSNTIVSSSGSDTNDDDNVNGVNGRNDSSLLNIGLVGFGSYGQVFATQMVQQKHRVSCLDKEDKSAEAEKLGVAFHYDSKQFFKDLDVVVLSVPLIALEETIASLPIEELSGKLVVDIGPLNDHPKSILMDAFANDPTIDVLLTNPLLGMLPKEENRSQMQKKNDNGGVTIMAPSYSSGGGGGSDGTSSSLSNIWEGRQMIYERSRVANIQRCDKYLKIFENARCEIIEGGGGIADSDTHDITIGDAEFMTHMIGRLLDDRELLTPTPIMSKEYKELNKISQMASNGSFDRFYGMYKYSKNDSAKKRIKKLRDNLASLECELAARGAYLSAKQEMMKGDRQKLLAETRMLLQELAKSSSSSNDDTVSTSATPAAAPATLANTAAKKKPEKIDDKDDSIQTFYDDTS